MSAWVAVGVLGAVSYALRSVVVVVLGDRTLPEPVARYIGHLAPAVLAALVAASLAKAVVAGFDGSTAPASVLARIGAVAAGAAVAVRRGSVAGALVAGVATYLVLVRVLG